MLSKSERDAIRARVVDCDYTDIGDGMMGAKCRTEMLALLDDLDTKDAEIAHLKSSYVRLSESAVLRTDRDSQIAEREATIAVMRKALEEILCDPRKDEITEGDVAAIMAALKPDAGANLLAEHAKQLAAYRKALELAIECIDLDNPGAEYTVEHDLRPVLQSPDPGKVLLYVHAAELERIGALLGAALLGKATAERRLTAVCAERAALRQRAEAAEQAAASAIRSANSRGDLLKVAEKRAEAAEANLAEERKPAHGHGELCYYCGKPINNMAGDPGLWAVGLCHADDPGRVKSHHVGCVSARLAALTARTTARSGSKSGKPRP